MSSFCIRLVVHSDHVTNITMPFILHERLFVLESCKRAIQMSFVKGRNADTLTTHNRHNNPISSTKDTNRAQSKESKTIWNWIEIINCVCCIHLCVSTKFNLPHQMDEMVCFCYPYYHPMIVGRIIHRCFQWTEKIGFWFFFLLYSAFGVGDLSTCTRCKHSTNCESAEI